MLKLHFKDNRLPPLWVVEKRFHIGNATENHLVLTEPGIDSVHAKLVQENNKYFLKDNNSSTGCFVNGQRVTHKEVIAGDIIRLATTEIIVLDPRSTADVPHQHSAPWRLVSESSWLSGKHFIIPTEKPVLLGRDQKCDIVIPGSHLSRKHLEISIDGNVLRIKDLKSANGTFLNEMRIDGSATAGNGDRLRLDVYNFRVVAPETEDNKTRMRKPIEELVRPIERKEMSSDPKRWKTRPTSPGNRVEPVYNEQRKQLFIGIALLIVAATIIAATILW